MKTSPSLFTIILLALSIGPLAAKKDYEVPLTAKGRELEAQYAKQLETLRKEVTEALPAVDNAKKTISMFNPLHASATPMDC